MTGASLIGRVPPGRDENRPAAGPVYAGFAVGGVFDQGENTAGHEAGGAHGRSAPGDLAHLDDAASGVRHLDAATRSGGADLVGTGTVSCVDDNLDFVTFHTYIGTR
ncbi:hypothetical protein GCM10018952_42810 [Streptosporangium vulgare]